MGLKSAHFRYVIEWISFGIFDEVHPGSSDGNPDILDGLEDTVGELAGFQELEHVFHRVQFRL